LIAGLGVVAIATVRVPGVLASSPVNALVLSAMVVGVWTVLFFFMRSFFERQGYVDRETTRRLIWKEVLFRWEEGESVLAEVRGPEVCLKRPAGSGEREIVSEEEPHPVWIVIDGEQTAGEVEVPLRLETKVTAGEAVQYEIDGGGEADDELSVGEVHTLLNKIERSVG
jgi:hypothetical protein